MTHKTVRIPLAASGLPAESVLAASKIVLAALEAYRIEGDALILTMLDEAAMEDRLDEI